MADIEDLRGYAAYSSAGIWSANGSEMKLGKGMGKMGML